MKEKEKKKRNVIVTNDLVTDLRDICYTNTGAYRSDFDKDAEIIMGEAKKPENERKTLLWMSYPAGTHCLYESDVFLKGSPSNLVWRFYNHQMAEAKKIAYALSIDGLNGSDKVAGILYELDFEEHCKRVEERAVAADYCRYVYEKGSVECLVGRHHSVERTQKELGKFVDCQFVPNKPKDHSAVLLTEELCRDGSKVRLYMKSKDILENIWSMELKKHKEGRECACLRCGNTLAEKLAYNSLSRYADVYVCSDCGLDEAIKEFLPDNGHPLNFKEWNIFKSLTKTEAAYLEVPKEKYLLSAECGFGEVFKAKKTGMKQTVLEAAYSRSYFCDDCWDTRWFLNSPMLNDELSYELEAFMIALLAMPEFSNLNSVKRAVAAAELSSNPSEFNLYTETYNFHIWIRMNIKSDNGGLHVHYYKKAHREVEGCED